MNEHAALPRALANVRAEEAVIGKIIGDANAYQSIAGMLTADHFTQQHHREIFTVVAKACEEGREPSISLLESRLPLEWEEVGSVEAVLQILIEKASDGCHPTDFVEELVSAREQRKPDRPPALNNRIHLVPFDEIKLSKRRRDLIKGIFPRVGLTVVWGPPKCGKSFWLFDCLMHVAMGWPYRGRRVEQGPIVYCAFEGQSGFEARVEAFRLSFLQNHTHAVPFYLQPVTLDLVRDHAALIAVIRSTLGSAIPVAVALDTLNRSLRGSESNDADMSAYISASDAIRDAFKCAVPIVHHCGVDGSRPRGHTSLTGAADAQIAVRRDGDRNIVVTIEDAKDSASGDTIVSKLTPIEVGKDQDGEAITSCIVVPSDSEQPTNAPLRKLSPGAVAAFRALHNCIAEEGQDPPLGNHAPAGSKGVTSKAWRSHLIKAGLINAEGNYREQFKRIRVTLQNASVIGVWEDFIWTVT
jgi:hypothetical protein